VTPTPPLRIPLEVPGDQSHYVWGDPDVFYQQVALAYAQAEAGAGRIEADYVIAGQRVRLRFAGPALPPVLTPALAHLAAPPTLKKLGQVDAPPALTIHLWEMETTGRAAPPPAWAYSNFQPNSLIEGFEADPLSVAFELGSNALSVIHHTNNTAYYWVKQAAQVPYYDRGSPLRIILHTWLSRRGVHLVHAGAVGRPEGGVLLAGRGGSGKSNTALAMLGSSLQYASDDYCLLTTTTTPPTAFSLYSTGKTHAADLDRLPFLRPAVSNAGRLDTEKALYFLYPHFPDKLIGQFPVRALLLPRVGAEARTQLRRITAAQGLAALTPSTVSQLPGIQASDFRTLVALARQVPSYVLEVGQDRDHLTGTVTDLVEALIAGAPPA